MKTGSLTLILFIAVSLALGFGEKKYGKALTIKQATKISEILAEPQKYHGKDVLVEGKVVDVCQKKGCWIKLVGESEDQVLQIKVEDDVIVFPKDGKGKIARAEGKVVAKEYSVKELIARAKHEAEEQGKPFDGKSITKPQIVVRVDGVGAVIRD
jgi:hypothetical protein